MSWKLVHIVLEERQTELTTRSVDYIVAVRAMFCVTVYSFSHSSNSRAAESRLTTQQHLRLEHHLVVFISLSHADRFSFIQATFIVRSSSSCLLLIHTSNDCIRMFGHAAYIVDHQVRSQLHRASSMSLFSFYVLVRLSVHKMRQQHRLFIRPFPVTPWSLLWSDDMFPSVVFMQGSFPKNHSGNAEFECRRRKDRGVGVGRGFCPSPEFFFDFGS